MYFNHFDSTILGIINHGQAIVVDGTHRSLRVLVSKIAQRLALRLGALPRASWRAQTRTPAGLTPALAMCRSNSALRRQRPQRWTPGVVVGPGAVGVR
jgi:hypothetical protein